LWYVQLMAAILLVLAISGVIGYLVWRAGYFSDSTKPPPSSGERRIRTCRHCYGKIDYRAKVCRHCRSRQSSAYKIVYLIGPIMMIVGYLIWRSGGG
jgi:hypothetical protein